jgi:hypothetical protein
MKTRSRPEKGDDGEDGDGYQSRWGRSVVDMAHSSVDSPIGGRGREQFDVPALALPPR